MSENFRGGIFFTHTVYIADLCVNQQTVCWAESNQDDIQGSKFKIFKYI